jgi:hypothetical protein
MGNPYTWRIIRSQSNISFYNVIEPYIPDFFICNIKMVSQATPRCILRIHGRRNNEHRREYMGDNMWLIVVCVLNSSQFSFHNLQLEPDFWCKRMPHMHKGSNPHLQIHVPNLIYTY